MLKSSLLRSLTPHRRAFARFYTEQRTTPLPDPNYNPAERDLHIRLAKEFEPVALQVNDISGGCGSMYAVEIISDKFKGLNQVKQHRMVNEFLKEDLKKWHGLRLSTRASDKV